jgi:hypothetical protein
MPVTTANLNAAIAKAQADYAVAYAAALAGTSVMQKATVTVKTNAKPLAVGAGAAFVIPHIIPWIVDVLTHVAIK